LSKNIRLHYQTKKEYPNTHYSHYQIASSHIPSPFIHHPDKKTGADSPLFVSHYTIKLYVIQKIKQLQ